MSRTITCNSVQCYAKGESVPLPMRRGDSGILAWGHDFLLKSALTDKHTYKFPKHSITSFFPIGHKDRKEIRRGKHALLLVINYLI